MKEIAYLGPRGSFAEAATRSYLGDAVDDVLMIASASVQAALEAVRDGTAQRALVPMENSVEGSVSVTLDELANGKRLVIVDEVVIPVKFALMVRPGTALTDVRRVATHPHAQAQVRGWLEKNLPDAAVIPSMSTAAAAAALLEDPAPFDAAIGQELAAELYGLEVLAEDIGDTADATTRFVVVKLPGNIPAATGADKTTLSLFIHQDQPGALLAILNEFAVRGVNLTRIESRPTRKQLGDYYFSVDVEGHVADARVAEALMGLHRVCLDVRFLGSYPRHDGKMPVLRAGVTDADFAEAHAWLRRLIGVEGEGR
jgi:prephenate dehydratase